MADVSVANTTSALSGKTLLLGDTDATITALHTFSRSTSAPFAVNAGAGNVANLDADKLDGLEGASYATRTGTETLTNKTLTSPSIATPTVTGAVTLSGGQIAFPSTQSASADVNTLDDYEEGSWTPTLGGSTSETGQAYTTQVGRYIKIGRTVTAQCHIVLSTKGTITGNLVVKGLPFTADNVSGILYAAEVGYWANLATSVVTLRGFVRPNMTQVELFMATAAAATLSNMTTTDVANTTEVVVSIAYRADA